VNLEPGTVADLWLRIGGTESMQRAMRVKGRPDFWILADGDDADDDQVIEARVVAALPSVVQSSRPDQERVGR
jgi:hypothetical protein